MKKQQLIEMIRRVIREESEEDSEDVRSHEFDGDKIYHGTSKELLPEIFRRGLIPKESSYDIRQMGGKRTGTNKGVYCTDKYELAYDYAGGKYSFGSKGMFNKVVLSFTVKSSDEYEVNRAYGGAKQIIIRNIISPDRLEIEYPKDSSDLKSSIDKYSSKTSSIDALKPKIKEINSILKPYRVALKLVSKTTPRLLIISKDTNRATSRSFLFQDLSTELPKWISNLSSSDLKKITSI